MKCEGCGLILGDAHNIHLTNGALTLCRQCLDEFNAKNPELKRANDQLQRILDLTGQVVHKTDEECVGCGCRMLTPEEAVGALLEERDGLASSWASQERALQAASEELRKAIETNVKLIEVQAERDRLRVAYEVLRLAVATIARESNIWSDFATRAHTKAAAILNPPAPAPETKT